VERRRRGKDATPAVSTPRSYLKSLRYLENSQINSELLQIAGLGRGGRRTLSMACGEIPYAAEQETRFAITAK
jgi:hypothetical protein